MSRRPPGWPGNAALIGAVERDRLTNKPVKFDEIDYDMFISLVYAKNIWMTLPTMRHFASALGRVVIRQR